MPFTVPSAAWISSSRSFFTLLLFFLAFFALPHHLVIGTSSSSVARRRKYSILSSNPLQNCHIRLWCHGCLICPFLKRRTLRAVHTIVTQFAEYYVLQLGQMHHSMSFQLIVVPDHAKQTLLKQCLKRPWLKLFQFGVPAATYSCPPPVLSSAHYTNVLHHPGSSDVGHRDQQAQNNQQPLASNS